jgi:uncharacterized protein (DUF885 family)
MRTSTQLITLLAGASLSIAAQAVSFEDWANTLANTRLRNDPELATQAQYFSGKAQDELDRRLTDNTRAFRATEAAAAGKSLARLAGFSQKAMTPQQRASAATIAWSLQATVDSYPYADYEFPLNQFNGAHVQIVNFMTQVHPIRNRRDVENYLVRLKAVGAKVEAAVAQSHDAAGRGVLMPDFITQASIGQLDRLAGQRPRGHAGATDGRPAGPAEGRPGALHGGSGWHRRQVCVAGVRPRARLVDRAIAAYHQ